jgi:imidazole glycerol-phosphate synthase subunit HisH
MMRVTVFDYGAGNLHSLVKTLTGSERSVRVETDARAAVVDTDVLVLPGVGAFAPAAERLAAGRDAMREAILGGLPTLGICLGMQLMFDGSDEGAGLGLGVIPGRVTKLNAQRLPQIGWNRLEDPSDALFSESGLNIAYYANSFACRPTDVGTVTAWSTHDGDRFPAAVRVGACVGVQFHPEKSSAPGVRFVEAFLAAARATSLSASTVVNR